MESWNVEHTVLWVTCSFLKIEIIYIEHWTWGYALFFISLKFFTWNSYSTNHIRQIDVLESKGRADIAWGLIGIYWHNQTLDIHTASTLTACLPSVLSTILATHFFQFNTLMVFILITSMPIKRSYNKNSPLTWQSGIQSIGGMLIGGYFFALLDWGWKN